MLINLLVSGFVNLKDFFPMLFQKVLVKLQLELPQSFEDGLFHFLRQR